MYLAPIQYDTMWESKITYWTNVYGVNMSAFEYVPCPDVALLISNRWLPFRDHAKDCHFRQSIYDTTLPQDCVLVDPVEIASLDLMTITSEQLDVRYNNLKASFANAAD